MLAELSIRDIVLIDRLDLSFGPGLSVLTGETGAGKSILLDALGLALGSRADSALVRHGTEQASVTATFELADSRTVAAILAEAGAGGLDREPLILRRVVSRDGRSRAFVNDDPVSVALLRRVGDALIEIQGQFDARGLLDPASHGRLLDDFADHGGLMEEVAACFRGWGAAREAWCGKRAAAAQARSQEEYLRHVVDELDALAPAAGEEAELAQSRTILANAEQVLAAMGEALERVGGEQGAGAAVAAAQRALDRVADRAGDRLDDVLAALDRSSAELQEAEAALTRLADGIDGDSGRLEAVDDRLHSLRAAARKHGVEPDALPGLHAGMAERLAAIEVSDEALAGLERDLRAAREAYIAASGRLSASRIAAAARLDQAIVSELAPLKLDKAAFATTVETLDEEHWTAAGRDRVRFTVAANPGTPAGPLNRVASGGELSRLLLALRVVLARAHPLPTLIFDEVDAGIGGAAAAAVGDRLQTLGTRLQVLVVTHSPQVAARGEAHWRIAKAGDGAATATVAALLDADERREEIARMLSGAAVTNAARAAADTLLAPQ